MSKKAIILISFFVVLSAGFLCYAGYLIKSETGTFFGKERLPVLGTPGHTIPGFSFTDQDGKIKTKAARSAERRVGKECRSRWSQYH